MKIKIECKTKAEKEAADQFLSWLCGSGEQQYWDWMEVRETEIDEDCTILRFNYDFKKLTADCELGRLDRGG